MDLQQTQTKRTRI